MGGRPRVPTSVLDARGAFKNHPERKKDREGEPQVSTPLGAPPDYFTDEQRQCWKEITERAPLGVLTGADTNAVELAASLMADFRRSERLKQEFDDVLDSLGDMEDLDTKAIYKLATAADKLRGSFTPSHHAQLTRLLSQLGMTPADRSKISIPKTPPKDEGFGKFT